MKCKDVRTFLSQIAAKSVSMQIPQADLDLLSTNGYISVMRQEEYDQASAEVANLAKANEELLSEENEEWSELATLDEEKKKTHSILFHFEGKEKKEAELQAVENEENIVSKEKADIADKESKINELIQKKSMLDRVVLVPSYGRYLVLTGLGVIMLNDLNVRNYRAFDIEFSDFIGESKRTSDELRAIAERGAFYVSRLRAEFPDNDDDEGDERQSVDRTFSQLWSVSIGLAKLQGVTDQVIQRFLAALGIIGNLKSTIENKMMAAEIMTAFYSSDLQNLSDSLEKLDDELRKNANVPKELSAGIAATIMAGRRFDGTYPTDRFVEFSKMTFSYESAAILSVANVPSDQLAAKFQSFRSLFGSWGYNTSEDTELAGAYLSISDLGPDDVRTKMTIVIDALKNYLEYPLVAAAILTSISTLEANETLDLMEKACSILGSVAAGLQRSELVVLAVRMIHGIRNELVKELDPTAKIADTPVQFTYSGSDMFFPFYYPLIIAHSSYMTYSRIGSYHPAHVHGVGGFMG